MKSTSRILSRNRARRLFCAAIKGLTLRGRGSKPLRESSCDHYTVEIMHNASTAAELSLTLNLIIVPKCPVGEETGAEL